MTWTKTNPSCYGGVNDGQPMVVNTEACAFLPCTPQCYASHGVCDSNVGRCLCNEGWRGPTCTDADVEVDYVPLIVTSSCADFNTAQASSLFPSFAKELSGVLQISASRVTIVSRTTVAGAVGCIITALIKEMDGDGLTSENASIAIKANLPAQFLAGYVLSRWWGWGLCEDILIWCSNEV